MRRHAARACDRCRRRKIRCDGQSPTCGRCSATGADCEFTLPIAKRGPKFRRGTPGTVLQTNTSTRTSNSIQNTEAASPPEKPTPESSSVNPSSITGRLATTPPSSRAYQDGAPQTPRSHYSEAWPAQQVQDESSSPSLCTHDHVRSEGGGSVLGSHGPTRRLQSASQEAHASLVNKAANLGLSLSRIAERSLDLAVQRNFPIATLFDPSALRTHIDVLLSSSEAFFTKSPGDRLDNVRYYALLTAICSNVCSRASPEEPEHGHGLAEHLLSASRQMLMAHEDCDVLRPDSRSLSIRIHQAFSLHYLGHNRLSLYILGQALRLAVDMRLSDEESYAKLDPREAQLQRNLYWILYTSDKSSSALNNTSMMLHDRPPGNYTEDFAGNEDVNQQLTFLSDFDSFYYTAQFERELGEGISLARRTWSLGSEIFRILDLSSRFLELADINDSSSTSANSVAQKMANSFITFSSLLDLMPPWLQHPDAYSDAEADQNAIRVRRDMFWMQKADLVVTHYFLRLILARQAFQSGYPFLLGMTANVDILDLESTRLAQDLVQAIREIPHELLALNGEALVEKLRRFGIVLLEISERSSNKALHDRASKLLTTLLDIVARLDSKASDNIMLGS